MAMQWEGKFGPAAIIGAVQLGFVVLGGVVFVQRMNDGIENSKQAVMELRSIVQEMQRSSAVNSERVTRVETKVDFLISSTIIPPKKAP